MARAGGVAVPLRRRLSPPRRWEVAPAAAQVWRLQAVAEGLVAVAPAVVVVVSVMATGNATGSAAGTSTGSGSETAVTATARPTAAAARRRRLSRLFLRRRRPLM